MVFSRLLHQFQFLFFITIRYFKGSNKIELLSFKSRVSFIVMTAGVSLLIVVLSVFNGFQKQVKESLWQGGPHITIESSSGSGEIKNYEKIIEYFKYSPQYKNQIAYIEGNISSHGLLRIFNSFEPVLIKALPFDEKNYQSNYPNLVRFDRDKLKKFNDQNYIFIGKEMSLIYNYKLNQDLTLTVPGGKFKVSEGIDVNIKDFEIIGLFKTGYYNFDSRFIFMSLKTAQKFFKLNNSVNQIAIKVYSIDQLKFIKEKLMTNFSDPEFQKQIGTLPPLNIRTIEEEQENFLAALKLEKTIITIIVFLFIILAALGMVASIYSLVRSKRNSIGTLKAMGLPSSSILFIFTFNSIIIGILASIVGGIIGIFIATNLETIVNSVSEIINMFGSLIYGFEWRPVELVPKDIYYFDHIPVYIDISFLFMVTTSATILSGIAGYFPAKFASEMNPIKTIRNE